MPTISSIGSSYGHVCFDELNERFGLTIQDGSGFDILLSDIVRRRPEVISAEVKDSCITMKLDPECCQWRRDASTAEQSALRLKDLLPLLKGGQLFLCCEEAEQSIQAESLCRVAEADQEEHALLDARVSEIRETLEGTEVELAGIAPEELMRFGDAFDAFMEAEQTMGMDPSMG